MQSRLRINAVAFVYNQSPVLVRTYTNSKDAELKYHYVAHTSLDVIDERTASSKNGDCYLGLLYTMEDLAVYALALADYVVRDADVMNIFKTLHTAYAASLSNPFLRLSTPPQADYTTPVLTSQSGKNNLGKRVDEIVRVIGTIAVITDDQV
ncbi:hypothetical protein RhiJN_03993 [Ceratobasidium sp. AG-Ba]|nr:hypothetical protein RhiJN_03993 [Ceratobasidium sp. AG-Ba]QRW04892.1 hypothetical protein RhiLY_03891 [Ceratobasidium sp. AG-Ba]